MRRVYQVEWTDTVEEPGDCLRACVASILNKTLKDVPHFIKRRNYKELTNSQWFEDLVKYFLMFGYRAYWTEDYTYDVTGNYSIGYGHICGNENWAHVVVCLNSRIVHDPSGEYILKDIPSRINLESII